MISSITENGYWRTPESYPLQEKGLSKMITEASCALLECFSALCNPRHYYILGRHVIVLNHHMLGNGDSALSMRVHCDFIAIFQRSEKLYRLRKVAFSRRGGRGSG